MILTFLLMAQLAAPAAPETAAASAPLVELKARVSARSLTIDKRGEVRLEATGSGRKIVDVQAPAANGRKTISNPVINVDARIHLSDSAPVESGNAAPQQ